MTVLPLYQVQKPDNNEAATAPLKNQSSEDGGTSRWSKLFWRPQAAGGCCGPQNRSMWLTVGLFAFAFFFLILIQNIAGYLAYHGYGVRYDYGIVLNDMRGAGHRPVAMVYRWDHIPWRCDTVQLSQVEDIHPPENQVRRNGPLELDRLLRRLSYHIPMQSRRDTSVYILTDYHDGGPTRSLDSKTSGRIIKEFGFDSVDIVHGQGFPAHHTLDDIAEKFLIANIESKCESMNAAAPTRLRKN